MKRISTAVFALLLCTSFSLVQAQPYFDQAVQLEAPIFSSFIDTNGNILSTGVIGGTDADIHISSLAPDGTQSWIKFAGSNTLSASVIQSGGIVAVGSKIYVAGAFDEAADFDEDGIDDITSPAPDTIALFIAQYENDGAFNWVKKVGNLDGLVKELTYEATNNRLYLTGYVFDEPGNFDGTGHMHVSALDTDGELLWTTKTALDGEPVTGNVFPYGINVDVQGSVYVFGNFKGNVDFDGAGPLEPVSTASTAFGTQTRAFLAKYNTSGEILWINYAGGDAFSFTTGLAIDQAGNVYTVGSYGLGAVVFENDMDTFSGPEPADNMFLSKYNVDGELQWAVFPNAYVDFFITSAIYANDLAVDPDGTIIYVAGQTTGSVDFNLDGIFDINTFSFPAFTAGYSDEGVAVWSWAAGVDAYVQHVISDDPDTFRLLGHFIDTIDFDGAGASPPFDLNGGRGYFLADFNLTDATIPVELTTFTATADGNTAHLSWATASELNNAGFEILHRPAYPNSSAREIQESPQHSPFIPGAGTTNEPQHYTHTIENLTPGTHHFQLKQIDFDGAFSMSDEITLVLNLNETYQLTDVYPNPFNPQASFSLTVAQDQEIEIALYDLLGRQVQSIFNGHLEANTAQQFVIDGSQLSSGTYIYRIAGQNFNQSGRVILLK